MLNGLLAIGVSFVSVIASTASVALFFARIDPQSFSGYVYGGDKSVKPLDVDGNANEPEMCVQIPRFLCNMCFCEI